MKLTLFLKKFIFIFVLFSFINLNAENTLIHSVLTKFDSDTISKFNGIDYYSGRMVKGFGFSFEQYLEEQINDRQDFESNPSLYYNFNDNISFEILNRTSMKKIMPNDMLDYQTNPISNITKIQAQIRPISGVQIFPYFEINNSDHTYNSYFFRDLHIKDEAEVQDIGFNGMAVTNYGKIDSEPVKLRWMHYTDDAVTFVNKDQIIIKFSGKIKNDKYKGKSENLNESLFPEKRKYETKWKEYTAGAGLYRGITKNFITGIYSKYTSFSSDLWNNNQGVNNESGLSIREYSIGPDLSYILNEIFNQFSFQFRTIKKESHYNTINFQQNDLQKNSAWNAKYSFHWLTHSDYPSLEKVLANANNFFGNRLPRGAFHLNIKMLHDSQLQYSKYLRIFETSSLNKIYNPDLKFQSTQLELAAEYGLLDYIEIGINSKIAKERISKPHPVSFQNIWSERESWENSISMDFGNYIFSENLKQRYGWYKIKAFDQYYGPILDRGMFKAKIEFSHIPYKKADDYFGYIDNYNPIFINAFVDNRVSTLSTLFRIGIWGNLELKYTGTFYYYSSDLRNYLDEDYNINFSIAWQPWKSLRFEICQNSSRYVNNWSTRFSYYYIDPTHFMYSIDHNVYNKTINSWNLRIVSLF